MIVGVLCLGSDQLDSHLDARNSDSWVAEWDKVWGPFGCHDSRDPSDAEDVTFVSALSLSEELPGPAIRKGHLTCRRG